MGGAAGDADASGLGAQGEAPHLLLCVCRPHSDKWSETLQASEGDRAQSLQATRLQGGQRRTGAGVLPRTGRGKENLGPGTRGAGPPGDTCVKRQREGGRLHAEEGGPRRNPPADILVLDSQPLELEKMQSAGLPTQSKALCYSSPRRGEFSPLTERRHVHRFLTGGLNRNPVEKEKPTDHRPLWTRPRD
ncbi:unnamed protein product [Rangifer tarandus platyrhynchus]|uniref:Uncharacterized protein n=1 Tax=Rangifer tarandus platyrhynchus TaxID=3082113 RepID=A0ACB1MJW2_RANTA